MRSTTAKLATSLVAAFVLLLTGAPASATTNDFEITCGTIDLGAFVGTEPIGTCVTTPCVGTGTATFDVTNTTGTATGPWSTAGTAVTATLAVAFSTLPLLLRITLVTTGTANNTGAITATGSTGTVTQNLRLRLQLFNRTGCTQGTLVCAVDAPFALTGTSAALPTVGTPPDVFATNATVTLSGTATMTGAFGQPCNPPVSTLVGTTATLTNVVFTKT